MMINKGRILVGLLFLSFGSVADENTERFPVRVSLVELIAHPDSFANSYIKVSGYLAGKQGLRLFLTEGYASLYDVASSVNVYADDLMSEKGLAASRCLNQYVDITAKFRKYQSGDYGLWQVENVHAPSENIHLPVRCWSANYEKETTISILE